MEMKLSGTIYTTSGGDVTFTGGSATGKLVINGVEVDGTNVTVVGEDVIVDGKKVDVPITSEKLLTVVIREGVINSLQADGDIIVKGAPVKGSVTAGGNVTCECVGGSVTAGHNVKCGRVGGSVTGHSVRHA